MLTNLQSGKPIMKLLLNLIVLSRALPSIYALRGNAHHRETQATTCATLTTSGYYHIIAEHSYKGLSVKEGSTSTGAHVIQSTVDETVQSDNWKLEDAGNGYYNIVVEHSGMVLSVVNSSKWNGARLVQSTLDSSRDDQKWCFIDQKNGFYEIRNVRSGKAVDVGGRSQNDGAKVQQWSYVGMGNQQWQLAGASVPAPPPPTPSPTPMLECTSLPDSSPYFIISSHSNMALNVDGASTVSGTGVIQTPRWAGKVVTKWEFQSTGAEGFMNIIAQHSSQALKATSDLKGASIVQDAGGLDSSGSWCFVDHNDGLFEIRNMMSRKSLDVEGRSLDSGHAIQQWTYFGGANQLWQVVAAGPGSFPPPPALNPPIVCAAFEEKLAFNVVSKQSAMSLNVDGGSVVDGANVIQSTSGVEGSSWTFKNAGDGFYNLLAVHSGLGLSGVVQAATSAAINNDDWCFVSSETNGYYALRNRLSGEGLEVTANGLEMGSFTGNDNQLWQIQSAVTPPTLSCSTFPANQFFHIVSKRSGMSLNVEGAGIWANVVQWPVESGAHDNWRFEATDDGNYHVIGLHGGALNVNNFSKRNGAYIVQWPVQNDQINDDWCFVDRGDGHYAIISKLSGKAIDVKDNSMTEGANIQQWEYFGGANQLWKVVPV